jgi:hypothetical protein
VGLVKLEELLFPQLFGKWAEVNLNALSLAHDKAEVPDTSPETADHWVNILHKTLGVNYSWGGYLEHRDHLLRGHYMATYNNDHFWHLGIDYNVPAGTIVHMPCDGELLYNKSDMDQDGGWGGKMIFKIKDDCYLILGHLKLYDWDDKVHFKKGDAVARIGGSEENGNWFPHLHIQCMTKLDFEVDGYSPNYEGIEKDYPNPKTVLESDDPKLVAS